MTRLAALRRWRSDEVGLSVVLAIQIAIMFVASPLAGAGLLAPFVIDLFRIAMAAAAVLLVARGRRMTLAVAATVAVSFGLNLGFRHTAVDLVVSMERLAAITAFDLILAVVVARSVFAEGRVTVHRIMGAVILYLSIGLIFANAYRAAAAFLHPSFSAFSAKEGNTVSQLLYFSLSTLTTTGFGDIVPLHPFIRSLANLEAVIGQLFPATLLARLVTLHAAATTTDQNDD